MCSLVGLGLRCGFRLCLCSLVGLGLRCGFRLGLCGLVSLGFRLGLCSLVCVGLCSGFRLSLCSLVGVGLCSGFGLSLCSPVGFSLRCGFGLSLCSLVGFSLCCGFRLSLRGLVGFGLCCCLSFSLSDPFCFCSCGLAFGVFDGGTQQADPVFQRQGGRRRVFGRPVRSLGQPVQHQSFQFRPQHADIAAPHIDLTVGKAGLARHLRKINARISHACGFML